MQMDESYNDGAAMLLLAQGYEKKGDQDKANTTYQKIIETWPDTDVATQAQHCLLYTSFLKMLSFRSRIVRRWQ